MFHYCSAGVFYMIIIIIILIKIAGPLMWISVIEVCSYITPHVESKIHILAHNPLFALFIFGGTQVIETIVTVVYKQGHLVLGFQPT